MVIRLFCVALLGLCLSACATTPPDSGETQGNHASAADVGDNKAAGGGFKVGSPYIVNGQVYRPREDYTYSENGVASWYGRDFAGKRTANGEIFNPNELTAAHKTLPLPCLVRVTNLDNGRAVVVRVNDRGPFSGDRIIDLSRRAAQLLAFENTGTAHVHVEVLAEESRAIADMAKRRGMTGYNTQLARNNPVSPSLNNVIDAPTPPGTPPADMGVAEQGAEQGNDQADYQDANYDATGGDAPKSAKRDVVEAVVLDQPAGAGERPVATAAPEYTHVPETEKQIAVPLKQQPSQSNNTLNGQYRAKMQQQAQAAHHMPTASALRAAAHPAIAAAPTAHAYKAAGKAIANAHQTLYVQAGAFASEANAKRAREKLQAFGSTAIQSTLVGKTTYYRVRIGPIKTANAAYQALAKVLPSYDDAHIISQ